MSGYQKVKDFIITKLKQANNIDIQSEVNNARSVLNIPAMHTHVFGIQEIKLSDDDWQRMQLELETSFNVKMEQGILIKGAEQQERDTTWWTGKAQQGCDSYYWDRYKEHLRSSLPPKVVKTIDGDTDAVMNNIENPAIEQFDRRGMVVGHVQSGKTGNYAGLICKAADAGYKFVVVIAGGINNLRNQTQERLNEAFIGMDCGVQVGVGKGNAQKINTPYSLTTKLKDFNKQDVDRGSQSINFDIIPIPIILVIKKNTHSLKNVIDWLNTQYPNKIESHAMLMIDDESDYASIDTSKPENEPTAINKGLRKILAKFNKSIYVAYTATPYANIFIDHKSEHEQLEDDLFPRDFIYALNAPNNYFGAREVFLNSNKKHLVTVEAYDEKGDIPIKHKKNFELPTIPKPMYEAMRVFLLNIAIRSLRGQDGKHNSMLIHATRFTAVHQKLAFHVEQYIDEIKKDVLSYGGLSNANGQSDLIQNLQDTMHLRYENLEFSWREILSCLCETIQSVVIREVHQQTTVPLEYRKDVVTNAIVIGGTSLSRGYTLEGLSVSYFLRNTVFYDTLMQMGRWFGYREDYQDLCRIYMSKTMIANFEHIIEATEDLINDFKKMDYEKMTPKDFGLAVKRHPDSLLQITARNKQRSTKDFVHSMCLDGRSKETSRLSNDVKSKQVNMTTTENTISKLQSSYVVESIGKNYLWRDVDKDLIIDFLNNFKVYQNDVFGIVSRMPINFIKKYAQDIDTDWDVAVYNGTGEEINISSIKFKRKALQLNVSPDGYIHRIGGTGISSETDESITLSEIIIKSFDGKKIRERSREKITNPLLRLYILEKTNCSLLDKESIAAFGISFPAGIISNTHNVNLSINTVYCKNLLKDLEYEEQADDY